MKREEFKVYRNQVIENLRKEEGKVVVKVGMGTCGISAGADKVFEAFQEEIKAQGLENEVVLKKVGCIGLCYSEPNVEVSVPGLPSILYGKVTPQMVKRIVTEHIIEKRVIPENVWDKPAFDIVQIIEKNGYSEVKTDNKWVLVCSGDECKNQKSLEIANIFTKELLNRGLAEKVKVIRTGCFGLCTKGPIVKILPDGTLYTNVSSEDVGKIIEQHIIGGKEVEEKKYVDLSFKDLIADIEKYKPYHKQFRIVLRNCGIIDPENIDEYIARGGYKALEKVLFEMKPEDVIEELKKSGLRGRGGAGFPTWLKWKITKEVNSDVKYIICNADEGDPGAYMDRSTLEGDPHTVIEGMIIAGYTVGSNQGYIYIRAEYPLAIKRLEVAIKQAREKGLLGKNILGSGFDFDIELRLGAGAFVCGEETALIASIEGKRGMPRPRPPYPSVQGLWGKPTVINNVETFANVPVIILIGGDWFAKLGTQTTKGTKVFALTGKVRNSGLVEVPMGMTLRDIIFNVGGGIAGGRKFKAVQTGGPSGGVIPEQFLDTPVDYENLQKLGSIMGSGGMIVMDDRDCMVDVAKFYLGFTVDESCGKCAPCRIGGRQMLEILEKISKGEGELQDIDKLKDIGFAMQKASLCGLGQTAPNPVLSTLKYFYQEYVEHIEDKRCKSGKCKNLFRYYIVPEICVGCTACALVCPVKAITGERRKPHTINQEICIRCGACYETCKFNAIIIQ